MMASVERRGTGIVVGTYSTAAWESECRWHQFMERHGYSPETRSRNDCPAETIGTDIETTYTWLQLRRLLEEPQMPYLSQPKGT